MAGGGQRERGGERSEVHNVGKDYLISSRNTTHNHKPSLYNLLFVHACE